MTDTQPTANLARQAEGLSSELKPWLNPSRPEHQATLIRTLVALRNFGGGVLLIGYNDDGTLRSDTPNFDIRVEYHPDKLHDLLARHASSRFSISAEFNEVEDRTHIRITVEAGIQIPVRIKKPVTVERDGQQVDILKRGEVPIRTLESNGRPSTSDCIESDDWNRLMQTCLDNREADIARFIRRHLSSSAPDISRIIEEIHTQAQVGASPAATDSAAATKLEVAEFLDMGANHFSEECQRRSSSDALQAMLPWGGREVAFIMQPEPVGWTASQDFLRRLQSSIPRLSSYPPWVAASVGDAESQPNVRQGRWEAMFVYQGVIDALSFEIFDPKGKFYERRISLLDVIARRNQHTPKSVLGERQSITDVVETIVTGLAFGEALGIADEHHELQFAFRWSGLKDRIVDEWFLRGPTNYVSVEEVSPVCLLSIPGDQPAATLGPEISKMMAPMFELFRGYQSPPLQTEETLREVISRRSRF